MKELTYIALAFLLALPARASNVKSNPNAGAPSPSGAPAVSPVQTLNALLSLELGLSPAPTLTPPPALAAEAPLVLPQPAVAALADPRVSALMQQLERHAQAPAPAREELREAPAALGGPRAAPSEEPTGLAAVAAVREALGDLTVDGILAMGASEAHAFAERVLAAMQGGAAGTRPAAALGALSPARPQLAPARVHPGAEQVFAGMDADYRPEPARVERLARAIERADWEDPVLDDARESVRLALAAHRAGRLSMGQFLTVVLRWEFLEEHGGSPYDLERVPLLDEDGRLTPEAEAVFLSQENFTASPEFEPALQIDDPRAGDRGGRRRRFEAALAALPASERTLFRLRDSAGQRLSAAFGVRAQDRGDADLLVPSFGILDAVLDVRYGEGRIELMPAFGDFAPSPRSVDDVRRGVKAGGRIFGLHYPGVRAQESAHGVRGKFSHTMHDYAHARLGSLLSPADRRLAVHLIEAGEAYRAELAAGGRPVLVDGGRRALLLDDWPAFVEDALDLTLQMGREQPSLWITRYDRRLPDRIGVYALIIRDMALNPALWEHRGVARTLADMDARLFGDRLHRVLYQEALAERRSPPAPEPAWRRRLRRLLRRLAALPGPRALLRRLKARLMPAPEPLAPAPAPEPPSSGRVRLHAGTEDVFEEMDAESGLDRSKAAALAAALARGAWDDPVLLQTPAAETARLALAAHRMGRLSLAQLATVILRWELIDEFGLDPREVEALPLLDADGAFTEAARTLFGGHATYTTVWTPHTPPEGRPEALLAAISALPASERVVFAVRRDAKTEHASMLRFFTLPDSLGKGPFAPSIGVMQAVIDAYHGPQALAMLPAFGDLTFGDRRAAALIGREIAAGGRILGLHFPGVAAPEAVHVTLKGKWTYTMHDYWHLYMGSLIAPELRRALVRVVALGEDLRRSRSRRAPPERILGREVRLPGHWDKAVESALDLSNGYQQFEAVLTSRFGEVREKDAAEYGVLALAVRDMARRPGAWAGLDIERMVDKLGPEARAIYEAERRPL